MLDNICEFELIRVVLKCSSAQNIVKGGLLDKNVRSLDPRLKYHKRLRTTNCKEGGGTPQYTMA